MTFLLCLLSLLAIGVTGGVSTGIYNRPGTIGSFLRVGLTAILQMEILWRFFPNTMDWPKHVLLLVLACAFLFLVGVPLGAWLKRRIARGRLDLCHDPAESGNKICGYPAGHAGPHYLF